MQGRFAISGAGLGLRRSLIPQIKIAFQTKQSNELAFIEIAPENWLDVGGWYIEQLVWFRERYPIVCHGLCLSLGGIAPLDTVFLLRIKTFLDRYDIPLYTEHLSYCTDHYQSQAGYLYDLLPIPFTDEAVRYVARRIAQTQDILQRRIAIENTSSYLMAPISDMDESTFINAVLSEADCDLHLDINNVYVNSVNFGFDATAFLQALPAQRVVYGHIAGHTQENERLLIDTHGEDVIPQVWQLLDVAYQRFGAFPTLLERDNNLPTLSKLMSEVKQIADFQRKYDSV